MPFFNEKGIKTYKCNRLLGELLGELLPMISLKNRLTLTYALFVSFILAVLTLVINLFTNLIFTSLIKDNIAEKSGEIVRVIEELYNPLMGGFDTPAIETVGMHFVHEGYIVTVKGEADDPVWDARSCDMRQCTEVIGSITRRMENSFGISGRMQKQIFPIGYRGRTVGKVSIETYGPFFFSGPESEFLSSINRLLLVCGLAFILLSIVISLLLSRAIARPIVRAGEAARQIAALYAGKGGGRNVRLEGKYKTRELEELSRSINELAEDLEEGERRQKQLTSDIAHELRTPLTCLQGNIEAMIDGVWEPDRERLESCHEEVLRLTGLVEDLNTLKGLEWETVTLNRTDFDLSDLLRLVIEQFGPGAREKGIALALKLPAPESNDAEGRGPSFGINADYDRFKQVFINLLSNAVKYTDSGSITVSIERRGGKKGEKNWDVVIADTGIGIPEEDLPRVFERFYRSDKSRSRGSGGAGIGLSIAAAIVAAHGGTISAESGAGASGALFRVSL
jgi:signal transduction histidine kinase